MAKASTKKNGDQTEAPRADKVPVAKESGAGRPVPAQARLVPGPWEHGFDRVFDRMIDRFFEDFGRPWPRLFGPERWLQRLERGLQMPALALDMYEDKDAVVVKAELPGVSKDDVEVTLEGSTLTIRGEKKKEEETKGDRYHRWERSYGGFTRTVELPAEVKAEAVKATFKDGVLEVRMPKSEAAKRKQVSVTVQ
jgi:HSP20 family protein